MLASKVPAVYFGVLDALLDPFWAPLAAPTAGAFITEPQSPNEKDLFFWAIPPFSDGAAGAAGGEVPNSSADDSRLDISFSEEGPTIDISETAATSRVGLLSSDFSPFLVDLLFENELAKYRSRRDTDASI